METHGQNTAVSWLKFYPDQNLLHSISCHGKPQDITRMRNMIQENPSIVNETQTISIDIGIQVRKEMLPLHHAAFHGHLNCVKLLAESGANMNILGPNYDDGEIKTVLEYTLDSPKEKMIPHILQVLIENGMSTNVLNVTNSGYCLLAYAIKQKWTNLTKLMIEKGALVEHFDAAENSLKVFKYAASNSPLSVAIKLFDWDTCKLLLINGASLVFNCCHLYDLTGMCSIPHFIIRSCFINENNKINQNALIGLYLYQQFGGNLWFKQYYSCFQHNTTNINRHQDVDENTGENILEFINKYPEHLVKIMDLNSNLVKWMQNPMSLKSLCRIALLRTMEENYWRNLEKLEIPVELREFLKFPNVDDAINSVSMELHE